MTERQYGRVDVDYATWYSAWMRRLASTKTRAEIERDLGVATGDSIKSAAAHERAIKATSSMTSKSARRAHTRNVTAAAGERLIALRGALEIHDLFPEYAMSA